MLIPVLEMANLGSIIIKGETYYIDFKRDDDSKPDHIHIMKGSSDKGSFWISNRGRFRVKHIKDKSITSLTGKEEGEDVCRLLNASDFIERLFKYMAKNSIRFHPFMEDSNRDSSELRNLIQKYYKVVPIKFSEKGYRESISIFVSGKLKSLKCKSLSSNGNSAHYISEDKKSYLVFKIYNSGKIEEQEDYLYMFLTENFIDDTVIKLTDINCTNGEEDFSQHREYYDYSEIKEFISFSENEKLTESIRMLYEQLLRYRSLV